MLLLTAGDLIRWKNPLYIVDNGKPIRANERWYHALVLEIREARIITGPSYETKSIRMVLIGKRHKKKEVFMTADALLGLSPVQRIVDCMWVELVG
ncbi:MAG TPA: hypothetical protein DEQ32_13225 [Gammaproteobacteria bacterium]|nr:hypothetical protein [Gammaproteobacteria bacterium]|tara:strand:- start:1613 stop:1900 length:288 start_codon:yes stop_codon:yes gene_type:complete